MIKLLSNLLLRAGIVKVETLTGANSAARVGSLLEDLAKLASGKFDATAAYDIGQYTIYNGILAEVLTPTNPGESPDTTPAKWSLKLVVDPTQVTAGNKLPVAASALKTLVDQIQFNGGIPNASTTQRGAARQSTDQEAALGANNDSYTTPKQLNDRLANFYSTYADAAIDKFAEDATDATLKAFFKLLVDAAQGDAVIAQLICDLLALASCGSGTGSESFSYEFDSIYKEQALISPVSQYIVGPSAMNEGTNNVAVVMIRYSDGSEAQALSGVTRLSSDPTLQWNSDWSLVALGNSTPDDTRTARLTSKIDGLEDATLDLTIYDASAIQPNGQYRIIKVSSTNPTEGDAGTQYKGQYQTTDLEWHDITDPYTFRLVSAPFGINVSAAGLLTCVTGAISADTTVVMQIVMGVSTAYSKTLEAEDAAGPGTVYNKAEASGGKIKDGILTFSAPDVPGAGNYNIAIYQQNNVTPTNPSDPYENGPIDNISVNGGAAIPITIPATDGVLHSDAPATGTIPLSVGANSIKITPSSYVAHDKIVLTGSGSAETVLASQNVTITNVDPTPDPNTIQNINYRFIKGGSIAGQPTDYIEVIMRDTYPDYALSDPDPIVVNLWLASSTPDTGVSRIFERKYEDGSPATDGLRHAYWENIGTLANKTFKLSVGPVTQGNTDQQLIFTIVTTGVSTSGFVQLYP